MKAKIFRMSGDLFTSFFTKGIHCNVYEIKENAIPDDARLVDIRFNGFSGNGVVEVLIESDEFEDIDNGKSYPEMCPVVGAIKVNSKL